MASSNLLAVTSMLPKVLFSGQLADTSDDALYVAPSPGSAVIKHGVVSNTSGATATLTMAIVPSAGSPDGTHQIISGLPLLAGDSLSLADYLAGCCLGPGDKIYAQAGTASVLDIVITGVENT